MGEIQPKTGSLLPSGSHVVKTDFLIVGAGVAGSALACFLASHGMRLLAIIILLCIDKSFRLESYYDFQCSWNLRYSSCPLAQYGRNGSVLAIVHDFVLLAHVFLECLRAIGLEEDCLKVGYAGEVVATVRWCKSMSGEEYGRVRSWGSGREVRMSHLHMFWGTN